MTMSCNVVIKSCTGRHLATVFVDIVDKTILSRKVERFGCQIDRPSLKTSAAGNSKGHVENSRKLAQNCSSILRSFVVTSCINYLCQNVVSVVSVVMVTGLNRR